MKKDTNVFVLTTEYHFLLAMNIILEHYTTPQFNNRLVFTGQRLSGVVLKNLPDHVETLVLTAEHERNFKRRIQQDVLRLRPKNIFVFTAYRDLETYLLFAVGNKTSRHLVQDGANFYFEIKKSVAWSRIKETIKIYKNLFRKGIFFKKLILYKKHLADCSFIDFVWVTNPNVYLSPRSSRQPVNKINLLPNDAIRNLCCHYFGLDNLNVYQDFVIYLSPRLTKRELILNEIDQVKLIHENFKSRNLLIKLHPGAPTLQNDLFRTTFGERVVRDSTPAELYISKAINTDVIGIASAALFYNNLRCRYFSLIKVYKGLGLFDADTEVRFPSHVNVIEHLSQLHTSTHDVDI
jgi:hypothetical protein